MAGFPAVSSMTHASPVSVEDGSAANFSYQTLIAIWVLVLFEPARFVSYYFEFLNPLKWIPTLLLLFLTVKWLLSPGRKKTYGWLSAFLLLNLFGTIIAFLIGNWGIARAINREVFNFWALATLSLTYIDQTRKVERLCFLFQLSILYYATLGVVYLHFLPFDPSADPATRVVIPWHHWLDNRDGFGPLMTIGLAFSLYYCRATGKRNHKWLGIASALLCVAGVVLSFGRGVFLAMATVVVYIWLSSKEKVAGLLLVAGAALLVVIMASMIAPGDRYWDTIRSINGAQSVGTGQDRMFLWQWAFREFVSHPIFGVGTGNFGIAVLKVVEPGELMDAGYTVGRIWGRALHCAPLQILCEHGLLGVAVFLGIFLDFIHTNRKSRRITQQVMDEEDSAGDVLQVQSSARMYYTFSFALMACFIAFWVNGIFYDILYAPFLWHLLTLNRIIYSNVPALG